MIEESVVTLIGSLGFPIVAYLLMFFKLDKTVEKLEQSINNNSRLVQAIIDQQQQQNERDRRDIA